MERASGVLMHISSIPSDYGIGTFGKEAYKFVDFLKLSGQSYWQILPLGQTSYGDSPYQSFSAFAGNPYFIDFDLLKEDGLLILEDYKNRDYGSLEDEVDYGKLFKERYEVLRLAFNRVDDSLKEKIHLFYEKNKNWLKDYALFMAVKGHFKLKIWSLWDEDIKLRKKNAIEFYEKKYKEEIEFWIFVQYLFDKQWKALKKYANNSSVMIIGDIPIYVAEDSSDAWANPEIFLLDKKRKPIMVAGCPPDAFSETGQLWGNPIYNWSTIEKEGFRWWIDRMKQCLNLFDVVRIDHFRGFEAYWEVPYGDKTAINGKWIKGPENKLFKAIKKELGEINIIAEDLGLLTEEVIKLRKETGFPGMKVLQFAFAVEGDSEYLPERYEVNSVAYTGTHDNDTVIGWIENHEDRDQVEFAKTYLKLTEGDEYNFEFIKAIWKSDSKLTITTMQDFLGLSSEGRMNTPSTTMGNWKWRAKKSDFTKDLAEKIYMMTKACGRVRKD